MEKNKAREVLGDAKAEVESKIIIKKGIIIAKKYESVIF